MDSTLIFMIIAIILVIYLIFKFIKKLMVAVLTLILFLVLIIAGIAGIVYMDYNYLTSQSDFNLKVLYKSNDAYLLGAEMMIKNKTPDVNNVKGILDADLISIKAENLATTDKTFVVVFDEELFKSIMTKDNYEIQGLKTGQLSSYDLSLTKFDVIEIINSKDDISTFLDIAFKRNKISGVQRTVMEPIAKAMIQSELDKRKITIKQAVFLSVISEEIQNQKNAVVLLEGFKADMLQIYPQRFSFKLVKILPIDMVKSYLPSYVKN